MSRISIQEALRLISDKPLDTKVRHRMRESLVRETEILMRQPSSRRRKALWGSALAACLVAGFALWLGGRVGGFEQEIATHHDHMVATGPSELQVRGDEAALADFFEKSLGFRPVFPARKTFELTIVGGRVCSIQSHAVAYAVYQWRGHLISYFGRHPEAPRAIAEIDGRSHGCTIVPIHSPAGDAYIVADLPKEELDAIFDWRTL